MQKHLTLLILLSTFFFSCSNSEKTDTTGSNFLEQNLDSLLNASINEGLTPGLALAVVSSTDVLYNKAFGVKEAGKSELLKTTNAFDFSSIVKTVVSTTLMREVEKGNIVLDNSASDYLSVLADHLSDPTVRQMLSHSSGIQFSDQAPHTDGILRPSDLKLVSTPGTKLQYSNAAFYSLGKMIQEQSGKTLEEYVETQIFAPLGMVNSSISTFQSMRNLTTPHTMEENKPTTVKRAKIAMRKIGNGVFYSTIEDMSTWAQMHLNKGSHKNRQILASSSYSELWKPNLETGWDKMKAAAGLGWFIGEVNGRKTASHIGGTNGYSAALVVFPDHDRAMVIAGNCNKLPRETLIEEVSKIIFE